MKKLLLLMASAALLFVACGKEQSASEYPEGLTSDYQWNDIETDMPEIPKGLWIAIKNIRVKRERET